jgi:hypothetical protein
LRLGQVSFEPRQEIFQFETIVMQGVEGIAEPISGTEYAFLDSRIGMGVQQDESQQHVGQVSA